MSSLRFAIRQRRSALHKAEKYDCFRLASIRTHSIACNSVYYFPRLSFRIGTPQMSPFTSIRKWLLRLELRYLRNSAVLDHSPRLRFLNRKITADITIIYADEIRGMRFRIDFRTPYFKFPVAVEKTQIGRETGNGRFQPASFRFFNWQNWTHIDGRIQWHGERISIHRGKRREYITGFSYAVGSIPASTENLGIRVAEGVEGSVSVLTGGESTGYGFEPGYWMLEPGATGYKIVAIADTELMGLIVSLSELGSGNQRLYASALQHLHQWVQLKLEGKSREQTLIGLLKYVRDWGPLGMTPLFRGLSEILARLGLADQEHVIYEFYADNWGVRNNWHGRLLAVRILEALATQRACTALNSIFDYVKNRSIEPEEMDLIRQASSRMAKRAVQPETVTQL